MSPSDVHVLTDHQIVEMLVTRPADEAAVAWLASVISSPALVEGVNELQRRYAAKSLVAPVPTAAGRHPHAGSVQIDPDKWRSFFWRRRIMLCEVGPLISRSATWGSQMAFRRHAGFYALDDLACALDMHVDQLISDIGSDTERARSPIGV